MNRTILAINGVDSSGATGLAADIKTFQTFRVYGVTAVTAVLAQNTQGTQACHPVPMEVLGQQIEAVALDIPIHGVKTGFLGSASNVQITASLLEAYDLAKFLVVDPFIVSSTGAQLLDDRAQELLKALILPKSYILCAKSSEAAALTGRKVGDMAEAKSAAEALFAMGPKNVVLTGGQLEGPRALDLWFDGTHHHVFDALRVPTRNTLGAGCTFSAILAALAVKGLGVGESVEKAKQYIAKAVQHPFQIGHGQGPLNHSVPM